MCTLKEAADISIFFLFEQTNVVLMVCSYCVAEQKKWVVHKTMSPMTFQALGGFSGSSCYEFMLT